MAKWDDISDLSAENVFDSRDVEEWIGEVEERISDHETAVSEWEGAQETERGERPEDPDTLADDRATLKALHEIRDACGSEWRHGVGYYRDSYFEDYAQELAEDCGYIGGKSDRDNPLLQCIDWAEWARMVQQDYSSIEVDGVTFWYRD